MRPRFGSSRSLALAASSLFGVAAAATYARSGKNNAASRGKLPHDPWANVDKPLPNRSDMLREIAKKTSAFNNNEKKKKKKTKKNDDDDDGRFDVLVIGGGATGSGVALDAQTRGLNTIVVEREDFGSGTSSKSTKLVHGGVRYLEKAVFNFDYGQLKLVFEALKERKVLLHNAPHLSHVLMIATPCYEWYEVPYYWAGMKAYDIVAGMSALTFSSFATSSRTIMEFPTVAKRKVLIDDEEEARKNYEQWKMREFKRVVRDRCKQRLEMEEEEERERLRNMTEEERELYATKLKALKDAKEHGKEKSKMRFMQKYYHKGAFFQDAGDDEFATTEKAEIFNRDFNEATNAEKGVDRTTVPEAMRLRQGQFGKAGRSKWTHLSNEDTTFVNTEDARLRNAQEALMKQKKLEEQPGADGVEENKSGGNFRGLGSRLAADKNVEKILDAKRAGMKSSKTTN